MASFFSKVASRLLSGAAIYDVFQRAVGDAKLRRIVIGEYLKPAAGQRVLEIGCGTGENVRFMPPGVVYSGFDSEAGYIDKARRKFGDRGEFVHLDVNASKGVPGGFDLVLVTGVVHHLDDAGAEALFTTARQTLVDGGRMILVEPAFAEGQSRAARFIIGKDRGRYVRTPDAYACLARAHFSSVSFDRRDDLTNIPYTPSC